MRNPMIESETKIEAYDRIEELHKRLLVNDLDPADFLIQITGIINNVRLKSLEGKTDGQEES